ncbi:hypothetical protein EK21DRAFT_89798 [Setomelanomma holmii]|uniref:FAD dependent oxidoreductase domain-containing protein n=1 Tax=Setomelanomma holmii TaxID=210430 RepID=A0A9P4H709_9PLEO|nr:hypothetical protein EK21DRAFT_89798 [Setomelanomma holmii]
MNKIVRSAYGSQVEYREMTFEAIDGWKAWNDELASGIDLPPGMTKHDKVFHTCGSLSMTDGDTIPPIELATIKSMEECGHKDTQLITTDRKHNQIAESIGLGFAMDPFQRKRRGKHNVGVLDYTGGMAVADKACRFALHKARKAGAYFVLEPSAGAFASFITSPDGRIAGIVTKDGKQHQADLTIMACGGWTPALLPQLDGLCGLYGFPRDEDGYMKLGYRGTKYTNPQKQEDGKERSVPVTRWTEQEQLKQIPSQAMKVLKCFTDEYLPELGEESIDIALTRVCWYTDTFDNHFIIDHVPGREGSFVATGGSGHAFKYLPNIGNWVVDVLEDFGMERPAIKAWKWRVVGDEMPANVLLEGAKRSRALPNVRLRTDDDMKTRVVAKL